MFCQSLTTFGALSSKNRNAGTFSSKCSSSDLSNRLTSSFTSYSSTMFVLAESFEKMAELFSSYLSSLTSSSSIMLSNFKMALRDRRDIFQFFLFFTLKTPKHRSFKFKSLINRIAEVAFSPLHQLRLQLSLRMVYLNLNRALFVLGV